MGTILTSVAYKDEAMCETEKNEW